MVLTRPRRCYIWHNKSWFTVWYTTAKTLMSLMERARGVLLQTMKSWNYIDDFLWRQCVENYGACHWRNCTRCRCKATRERMEIPPIKEQKRRFDDSLWWRRLVNYSVLPRGNTARREDQTKWERSKPCRKQGGKEDNGERQDWTDAFMTNIRTCYDYVVWLRDELETK